MTLFNLCKYVDVQMSSAFQGSLIAFKSNASPSVVLGLSSSKSPRRYECLIPDQVIQNFGDEVKQLLFNKCSRRLWCSFKFKTCILSGFYLCFAGYPWDPSFNLLPMLLLRDHMWNLLPRMLLSNQSCLRWAVSKSSVPCMYMVARGQGLIGEAYQSLFAWRLIR